jgi:hypothetical protein
MESDTPERRPRRGRLLAAAALLAASLACPAAAAAVAASHAGLQWKAAAGGLCFPVPQLLDVAALALVGRGAIGGIRARLAGWLEADRRADDAG